MYLFFTELGQYNKFRVSIVVTGGLVQEHQAISSNNAG